MRTFCNKCSRVTSTSERGNCTNGDGMIISTLFVNCLGMRIPRTRRACDYCCVCLTQISAHLRTHRTKQRCRSSLIVLARPALCLNLNRKTWLHCWKAKVITTLKADAWCGKRRWLSLQRGASTIANQLVCALKSGHVHSRYELEHEFVHPDDNDSATMTCGEIAVIVTVRVCNKHEDTDGCERNISSSPSLDSAAAVGARRVICIAADTLMLSVRGPTSARPGPVRILISNYKQLHKGDVTAIRLWKVSRRRFGDRLERE